MSDHPMALVYVHDMHAMLADIGRCLDHLRAGVADDQLEQTARELRRTAAAFAEFSAAFNVPDCAAVAEALAQAFTLVAGGGQLAGALLASATDALDYLLARGVRMTAAAQLVAPTADELTAANRIVARVVTASDPAVAWHTFGDSVSPDAPTDPDLAIVDEPAEFDALSASDVALIQAFQNTPLTPHGVRVADQGEPRYTAPLDPVIGAMSGQFEGMPEHLRQVFLSDLEHNLQDMHHALAALERAPDDRSQLATMSLVAHRMKGDAATFEYAVLAELAHAFEDQVRALQTRRVPTDQRAIALLTRGLAELDRASPAAIVGGTPPDAEALDRMRSLTSTLLEQAPAASQAPFGDAPTQPVLPLMSSTELNATADSDSGGSMPRATSGEPLLRVDVRRMDELMRRTSALAVNRAELEQTRTEAIALRADLERAVGRLDTLSARLREFPPTTVVSAALAPAPPAAPPIPDFLRDLPADTTLAHVSSQSAPLPATTSNLANVIHPTEHPTSGVEPSAPEVERYSEYDQLTLALNEAVADVAACGTVLRTVLQRLQRLTQAQEGLEQDIQQAVMRIRLVPLREQMVLLQQTIRVLAQQQGKSVVFATRGELAEIDRDVSEALSEVLLHLVRNAVTHGIERPEERFAAGKTPEGQITLSTEYSGNEVTIEVRDDGRGINPERVRASARASETIDAATALALSPEEALNLIFQPGVSTMARATVAAGHGIGMADVAAMLARLHGSIQVRSALGTGTTFTLCVPIALSNVRSLRIRVAGQDYVVPQSAIQQTLPLPAPPGPAAFAETLAVERVPGEVLWRLALVVEGRPEEVPLYALAHLLGRPYLAAARESALIIEVERRRLALVVDHIAGNADVVVRSLPAHLQRRGVRGTTITSTGEVLLVLDLPALVERVLAHRQAGESAPRPPRTLPVSVPAGGIRPCVLIADDSLSIRHAVEAILTRAGYTVHTARDGMEALEQLLADPPQLLVLDIEMPRLDGFELLGVLRAQPKLATIPVAMLTSRGAQRHRHHAEALGADAYLVKPVTEDDLLATVARLLAAPAQASERGGGG